MSNQHELTTELVSGILDSVRDIMLQLPAIKSSLFSLYIGNFVNNIAVKSVFIFVQDYKIRRVLAVVGRKNYVVVGMEFFLR